MPLTNEDKKWIVETVMEIIHKTVPVIINKTVPIIINEAINTQIKPLIEDFKWDNLSFTKTYVDSEIYKVKQMLKDNR